MNDQRPTVTASVTTYGNPYATLTPARVLDMWGRGAYVDTVYWDSGYSCYMARGAYARQDGTRGRQRAHAPIKGSAIPTDVVDALAPLMPASGPQAGPRQ